MSPRMKQELKKAIDAADLQVNNLAEAIAKKKAKEPVVKVQIRSYGLRKRVAEKLAAQGFNVEIPKRVVGFYPDKSFEAETHWLRVL